MFEVCKTSVSKKDTNHCIKSCLRLYFLEYCSEMNFIIVEYSLQ